MAIFKICMLNNTEKLRNKCEYIILHYFYKSEMVENPECRTLRNQGVVLPNYAR